MKVTDFKIDLLFEDPYGLTVYDFPDPPKLDRSSPKLAIVGGLHGNEFNSIYICTKIVDFLKSIEASLVQSIRVIPAVNLEAFDLGFRSWPLEGVDIYESYIVDWSNPRIYGETTSERIAGAVLEKVCEADYVIDIHSSNRYIKEYPHVRYYLMPNYAKKCDPKQYNNEYPQLAKSFGLPVVWEKGLNQAEPQSRETPAPYSGMLSEALLKYTDENRVSCRPFILMAGIADKLNKKYCIMLLEAIMNFMLENDIIKDKLENTMLNMRGLGSSQDLSLDKIPPIPDTLRIQNKETILSLLAPIAGIFVSAKELGEEVSPNVPLGEIISPFTDKREHVIPKFPAEKGFLLSLRTSPVVYEGCLLARIVTS